MRARPSRPTKHAKSLCLCEPHRMHSASMCIQAGILSRSPTYIVNTMLKRKSHVHAGTEMLQGNCACAVLPVCTSRQDAPGSMQEQNILGVAEIYRPQVFNPPRAMHMLHTDSHLPSWDAAATAADMSWCSGLARYKYGAGVKRPLTIGACCSMASRAAMRSSITCK